MVHYYPAAHVQRIANFARPTHLGNAAPPLLVSAPGSPTSKLPRVRMVPLRPDPGDGRRLDGVATMVAPKRGTLSKEDMASLN